MNHYTEIGLNKLIETLGEVTQELEQKTRESDETFRLLMEVKEERDEFNAKVEELQASRVSLYWKDLAEKREQAIRSHEDNVRRLTNERDSWKERRDALYNEYHKRRKENEKSEEEIAMMKARMNDKTVLIKAIQKENEILEEHNQDYQERVMNAETAVRERDSQIAELKKVNEALRERDVRNNKEHDLLYARVAQLKAEQALDHVNIDDRNQTIKSLGDEVGVLYEQRDALEDAVAELEHVRDQVLSNNKDFSAANVKLVQERLELLKARDAAEQETERIRNMAGERGLSLGFVDDLERALAQVSDENKKLRGKVKRLEHDLEVSDDGRRELALLANNEHDKNDRLELIIVKLVNERDALKAIKTRQSIVGIGDLSRSHLEQLVKQKEDERNDLYNQYQALIAVCMNVLNQHKEASTSLLELEQIVNEEIEEEEGE